MPDRTRVSASVLILVLVLLTASADGTASDTPPGSPPEAPSLEGSSPGDGPLENPPPDTDEFQWRFFSDRGRAFAPLRAAPKEAQVMFKFLGDTQGGRFMDLDLGGDLGLVHAVMPSEREEFSLTVRALVSTRFEMFSESFDLVNSDFRGGVAAGYRRGDDSYEALLYHQSSHLGDEIVDRDDRERIDYSRETLQLLWSHDLDDLRVYLGASVHLRAEPDSLRGRVGGHLGFEHQYEVLGTTLHTTVDSEIRGEDNWVIGVSARIGIDLGNPDQVLRPQRFFLEFYTGPSRMGQFLGKTETTFGLGIGWVF